MKCEICGSEVKILVVDPEEKPEEIDLKMTSCFCKEKTDENVQRSA